MPAAPTNLHMTSPFVLPRVGRRAAILAAALASVVAFASVVDAATSPVLSVAAAESRLNEAVAVRRTAEQRVAELEQTQGALPRPDRQRLHRDRGRDHPARRGPRRGSRPSGGRLRERRHGQPAHGVPRLRRGRGRRGPQRDPVEPGPVGGRGGRCLPEVEGRERSRGRRAGGRLHGVSRELTDAQSDLLQAEAHQADAERGVTAARRAERDAAAASRPAAAGPAAAAKPATAAGAGTAPTSTSRWPTPLRQRRRRGLGGASRVRVGRQLPDRLQQGRYRGAYQFDQRTWDSVAVTASRRTSASTPLRPRHGAGRHGAGALRPARRPAWPHCGRHLP